MLRSEKPRRLGIFFLLHLLWDFLSQIHNVLLCFMKLWSLGIWRDERRGRTKRAHNSTGTGWGEEGAQGFPLRSPQRFLLFSSFQPSFLPTPSSPIWPCKGLLCCLPFTTPHTFALLFFFPSPLLPHCPQPWLLIEISLMHFFLDFNGLFCLPSVSVFSLSSLTFTTPPPLFCHWSPRETTTIPLGQDDGAVRVPSASSPPNLRRLCPGPREDLEWSAGSVRETNGK